MAGESERALGAAAKMLFDTARSLDHFVEQMETLFQKQEHVLDRIADKIAHSGKSGGAGSKISGAIKGVASDFKSLTESLGNLAEAGPKLKTGFQALTNGLKSLNTALKIYATVPKESVNRLTSFLESLSKKFEEIKIERIQKGADALKSMAGAIVELGLSLLASTLLYTVAAVGSVIIIPMIAGYSLLFNEIGKFSKPITEGSKTMQEMGLGLLLFGLGLYAVKELAGSWKDFAEGSIVVLLGITVFAFAFDLLGRVEKNIKKGADALVFAGLALASIAIGIFAFQLLNIGIMSVLTAGLAVAAVGVAFALAGEEEGKVLEGVLGLEGAAIALASIAFGIWMFKKLAIGVKDVLVTGLAVLTMGVLFGLAGAAVEFIGPGVLAMAGIGIVLVLMAYGFKKFKDAKIEAADIAVIAGSVVAVGAAFALAGVGSLFIGLGAISMLAAGAALTGISVGLKLFKDIKYTDDDATKIRTVVGSLAAAFSQAGSPGMNTLFGFSIGPNAVEKGIDSVMRAGEALTNIAQGVQGFANLTFIDPKTGKKVRMSPGDLVTAGQNISDVLMLIKTAFAAAGGADPGPRAGLLGLIGFQKPNDVERGVDSLRDSGRTLLEIAQGVQAFASRTFTDPKTGKKVPLTPAMLQAAGQNIKDVVTLIAAAFAAAGGADPGPRAGLLGLIGFQKPNDVERGVDSIKGVGKELLDIANAVNSYAKMTFVDPKTGKAVVKPNITAAVSSISDIIGLVGDAFAAIGGKKQESTSFWKGLFNIKDNSVQAGIEAVKGAGSELKTIADAVTEFANIKDLTSAKTNIKEILNAFPQNIVDAYTNILSKQNMYTVYDSYRLLNASMTPIVTMLENFKTSKVTPGDASKLSKIMQSLMSGLSGMKISIDTNSLSSAVGYMERLAATSDPMSRLANSFEKIAKNMDKFAGSFKKMDKDALRNSDMMMQSMTVLAKVDPAAFDTLVSKGKNLIDYIYTKQVPGKEAPAPAATPLPKTPEVTEPGKKAVKPAPAAEKGPSQDQLAFQQTVQDLSDSMTRMTSTMASVLDALHGTLKVTDVNR